MKVSVSMYSLASTVKQENWSVTDFIQYAKSIPVDGVELLDVYWKRRENKDQELAEVKAELVKQGLPVCAYDVTNNFVKASAEERAQEVEKVKDGIRVAVELNCPVVRTFCGDLNGAITYEDGQRWIVEGLKECAALAEKEHVYLAIENHGLLAGKSGQVKEIISKVDNPYVQATFDTGNFLLVHESPMDAFNQLKDKIIHVHFKDFREKTAEDRHKGFTSIQGTELLGTIPGDGEVDLAYIMNGLKEMGYNGWLSMEYEGLDDAKEANEEAVRRLRQYIQE
ncbi:sugar phosphate isomerase/epimerase family protein [Pontibacillus salicampi]|uniref:Sugar phosphate isomerase/epimerase family protein n=1 Tax=Pontibacillus salicampi TaxID=1449801 RepID=A0ABV6LQM1_9BACI